MLTIIPNILISKIEINNNWVQKYIEGILLSVQVSRILWLVG